MLVSVETSKSLENESDVSISIKYQEGNGYLNDRRLESFGHLLAEYVLNGAEISIDSIDTKKIHVGEGIISFEDQLWRVFLSEFRASEASTIYYIGFLTGTGYVFGPTEPTENYMRLWTIETDLNGLPGVPIDYRGALNRIKFKAVYDGVFFNDLEVQEAIDAATVATTNSINATNDTIQALIDVQTATTNAINAANEANTAAIDVSTAVTNANTAADSANTAKLEADTATAATLIATTNADLATQKANTAAVNVETATADAITAKDNAITATTNANTATTNANTATTSANAAKDATLLAKTATETATTQANTARDSASAAASGANTAKDAANTAASSANTATGLANTATTNANNATTAANTATTNANNAAGSVNTAKTNAETATTNANNATNAANTAKVNAETATTNANTATTNANNATTAATTAATNANNAKEAIDLILPNVEGLENRLSYSSATQYYLNNIVENNGSSFQALQDSLGQALPVLPAKSNAYWILLAQRGVDGTGSVSSVNNVSPDAGGNVTIDVIPSWTEVTEKPLTFAPSAHQHAISEVTNLQTTLDGKVDEIAGKQLSTEDYTTTEKTKLAGVAQNANNYTHPTGPGNNHVPTGGVANNFLQYSADGVAVWSPIDGSEVVQSASYRFVTDTEKTTFNGKETPTGAQTKATQALTDAKSYTDTQVAAIVDTSPDTLNTLNELAQALGDDPNFATTISNQIGLKVDKVTGKQLSTEDYTTAEKTKLTNVEAGAQVNDVLSVNGQTGAITGLETTTGSQNKVDASTGNLSALTTTNKANLVGAVNEVVSNATTHATTNATDTVFGHVRLADLPKGKRTSRLVIGTSTAGWTASDCDYLCDGVDDQVEINNAIAALPTTGGEITVLDGTYNIAAKVSVNKSGVKLKGNSKATIFKRMFAGTTYEGVIQIETGTNNCEISDLSVDGNNAVYTTNYLIGIMIKGGIRHSILNTCAYNNNTGIGIDALTYSKIAGNTCYSNKRDGLSIMSATSSHNSITGNVCYSNEQTGINVWSATYNSVTGNTCRGNTLNGIQCYTGHYNAVTGNTCVANLTAGIQVNGGDSNAVSGNSCYQNEVGIKLDNAEMNVVTGNLCMRGWGVASNYTATQYTILIAGTGNLNNLIGLNMLQGKDMVSEGGTGNTIVNNKFS